MAPDTQSIDCNATFLTLDLAPSHLFENPIDEPEHADSETLSAARKPVDLDDDEDDEEEEDDDFLGEDDEDEDVEEYEDDDEDEDEEEDDDDEDEDEDEADEVGTGHESLLEVTQRQFVEYVRAHDVVITTYK